jgi:hypothetical protein
MTKHIAPYTAIGHRLAKVKLAGLAFAFTLSLYVIHHYKTNAKYQ